MSDLLRFAVCVNVAIHTQVLACANETITHHEAASAPLVSSSSDMLCGPRCVAYILRHHHNSTAASLYNIVFDSNAVEPERPWSLYDIAKSLRRDGIPCEIRYYPDLASLSPIELKADFPAILHIKGSSNRFIGHFVVLKPRDWSCRSKIWDGIYGDVDASVLDACGKPSGYVLFTGPDGGGLRSNSAITVATKFVTCVGLVAFAALAGFWIRRHALRNRRIDAPLLLHLTHARKLVVNVRMVFFGNVLTFMKRRNDAN